MEASNQKDTEPRASASGYLKVKQLVSNAAARIAEIRLLTRAALFASMPSCVQNHYATMNFGRRIKDQPVGCSSDAGITRNIGRWGNPARGTWPGKAVAFMNPARGDAGRRQGLPHRF